MQELNRQVEVEKKEPPPGRGRVPEGEGHRSLTAAAASPVAEAPTAGAKRRRSADPPGTSEGEPAVAVGGRIAIGDVVAVARGARVVLGPEVRDAARSGARRSSTGTRKPTLRSTA